MSNENTVRFDDIDVPAIVDLAAGTAQRDIAFETNVNDLDLDDPNDSLESPQILAEGIAGNLYYNFHTNDFPGGELRSQLELSADNRDANGVGTVVFTNNLSGDQEVPPADTDAFGSVTTTFEVAPNGSVDYNTDAFLIGISPEELLPVDIGNGTLSPIHLHNAPAGENDPVVVDVANDAGEEGIVPVTQNIDVTGIANVVGSNDGDTIAGDDNVNLIQGLAGNDSIAGLGGNDTIDGGGGTDTLDGGEGHDTQSFATIGAPVIADLASGSASYQPDVEAGVTVFENSIWFP